MSAALPGSYYCSNHQGNHSHYDEKNCVVCNLERELAAALKLANDNLFRPIGDNHHNALLCPYCNPDRGIQKAKEEAERDVQNALEMLKSAQCPVGCSDGMIINGGPDPVYEQCEWCYGRQMLIDAALDASRKEGE